MGATASTNAPAGGVLDFGFMMTLHRRMFGDVWTWAGTQRRRVANIGNEPHLIPTQCRLLFDDAKLWHAQRGFGPDELAARIHGRLVSIHPFPNGNGRATRMMADLYLVSIDMDPFTWGGTTLDVDGSARGRYITAVIEAADADDYIDLIRFARG